MTTIFFDTNIVMNESFLRSITAHTFFKACAQLKFRVAVPEIVIDEVKGNFPKKLNDGIVSYNKSHSALAKLLISKK